MFSRISRWIFPNCITSKKSEMDSREIGIIDSPNIGIDWDEVRKNIDESHKVRAIHWTHIQDKSKSNHSLPPFESNDASIDKIKKRLIWDTHPGAGNIFIPLSFKPKQYSSGEVWHYDGICPMFASIELYPSSHGLYDAIHAAWANHGKIILSPDDIWLRIQLYLSKYINSNAELLRKTFVVHEGKKTISVDMTDRPSDWDLFMDRTIDEINKSSIADIHNRFIPKFTTSTDLDNTMKNLAVMDCMKQYFDFKMVLCCGITDVGLIGEDSDWELLHTYVVALQSLSVAPDKDKYFNDPNAQTFTGWISDLRYICKGFIQTIKQEPAAIDFWKSIITLENIGEGSGITRYLSGWITALVNPLRSIGSKMDVNDIKTQYFNVGVTHSDNGFDTKINIIGGQTGFIYNKEKDTYSVNMSYAVIKPIEELKSSLGIETE